MNPTRTCLTALSIVGLLAACQENLSLKIKVANNIENTVSPLANSDVSAAVVCVSPRKNKTGAIVAPHTAVAKIRK